MIELTTARLRFRQWREDDFPVIREFFGDPVETRFVGGQRDAEQAWRLLATYIGHYQLKGYSYLAVVEADSGDLVGSVGLWRSEPWPELELGYWFLPQARGRGYASEAAGAVRQYAFERLGVDTLVSYIDEDNTPSRRLAERIGGRLEGSIGLLDFGEHLVYRYRAGVREQGAG